MKLSPRRAVLSDCHSIQKLLVRSARELQRGHYSQEQIEAATGPVFGVDEQMIEDETYFVIEDNCQMIGCGGWSFREALFGGRQAGDDKPRRLDPDREAARVRAYFVDPDFARQGVASCLMKVCEEAMIAHGFKQGEISATLAGEAFYQRFGYTTTGYYQISLEGVAPLRVARMVKTYEVNLSGG